MGYFWKLVVIFGLLFTKANAYIFIWIKRYNEWYFKSKNDVLDFQIDL
jgi:hypothetical protein